MSIFLQDVKYSVNSESKEREIAVRHAIRRIARMDDTTSVHRPRDLERMAWTRSWRYYGMSLGPGRCNAASGIEGSNAQRGRRSFIRFAGG